MSSTGPIPSAAPADEIPASLAVGWSTGAVCSSLAINVVGVLLLPFMTTRLGIAAAAAGFIISVNKFLGLGFDPLFGYLSDRTRSAVGRRRPWLLGGTAVLAASLVMLFRPPALPQGAAMLAWYALGLTLFGAGYAAFRVPYLTMSAEMTTSTYVRARLISFKVVAISAGTLLGLSLAPALVDVFGNDRASYGKTILVIAGCVLLSGIACFGSTGRARFASRIERPSIGIGVQLRSLAANAPLAALVGSKFIVAIGITFQYSCVAYFVTLVAHQRVALVSLYFLVGTIVTILSQPLWLRVVRAVGKRVTFCLSAATYVLGNLGWLAVGASGSVAMLVATALIVGVAGGGTQLTTEAMLPDVMSLDVDRTGLRREGTIAALFSVAEKLSSGIAIALLGGFLSLAGFVHSTHDVAQPESARRAIALAISVIPSAAALVAGLLILLWGLRDAPAPAMRARPESAI